MPAVCGYASRIREFNREAVERHMAELLQSSTALGEALRTMGLTARQRLIEEAYQESLRATAPAGAQ